MCAARSAIRLTATAALLGAIVGAADAAVASYIEVPSLAEPVASGELPPGPSASGWPLSVVLPAT